MWPKSYVLTNGATQMRIQYIKFAMCLRLPVCDQSIGAHTYGIVVQEDGSSALQNRDCGGKGTCRWNMRLGNHCDCDIGHEAVHVKGSGSSPGRNLCCPSNSLEKCKRTRAFAAGGQDEPQQASVAAQEKARAETKKAFIKGFSHGYSAKLAAADVPQPELKEGLSELNTTDNFHWNRIFAMSRDAVHGPKFISKVCRGLAATQCVTAGCFWEGKCKDATRWECANRKKILGCFAFKKPSPWMVNFQVGKKYVSGLLDVTPQLQQFCAKNLLGLKNHTVKLCEAGYRLGNACNIDDDCPCMMDFESKDTSTQLMTKVVTKKRCKPPKDPTGRWVAKCKEMNLASSCAAEYMVPCSETDMRNIPALAT